VTNTTVPLAIAALVLLMLAFLVIVVFNRLIGLRNISTNAFSQIDVQLKRRYDLIPALVETVKGYVQHERATLEAVIESRRQALAAERRAADHPGDAAAIRELARAEATLSAAASRLSALAEAYPDLKANSQFLSLQEELTSAENRVGFARQAYNDAVMDYNTARETFPNSLVARMFRFQEAPLFEIAEPAEREATRIALA
jgi:LemA protein